MQLSRAQLCVAAIGFDVSKNHRFYFGDCCSRAICKDVYRKDQPAALPRSGSLSAIDYHQLRRARCALQNTAKAHTFVQSALYGFGAALGFSLVLVLFSAMRERLAVADVPMPFKGAAIGMVTAGLMSLAFMGFSGLV